MRVLLPAPFSPSRTCTSPRRRSKSTPSSATTPGKVFRMPSMRSNSSWLLTACSCSLRGTALRRRCSPQERRTTRRAGRVTDCGGPPSMRSTSARTAARPSSPVGWAIAVIGGSVCTNHGMSSNAASAMSSGTRSPRARIGVQGAERHQVVGGEHDLGRLGQGEEALGDPPPAVGLEVALPDVGVGQRRARTRAAPPGRPRRARWPVVVAAGPAMMASLRWPSPCRWATRSRTASAPVGPHDGHVHARGSTGPRRPSACRRARRPASAGEPPSVGETRSPSIRRSRRVRTWWSCSSGRSSALPMITL